MRYKKNIKLVTFLLIILFAVTCTEDEMPARQFPSVRTLEVSNITNSGAKFNAEILSEGNQEIVEYGFIWSQKENPTIETSDKKVFADEITSGGFSFEITSTLIDGKRYYVRAYARSNEYFVYGTNISFLSLGSGAATIEDFYPKLGTWGDTINIKGNHFSYLKDHNKVLFKEIESKIISNTDSTIICIVPEGVSEKSVPISVKIADQLSESKDNFEFIVPEIESFSPMKGTFKDTIKIIGKNFSPVNSENIIRFNGYPAEVIESTETSLSIIVPTSLDTQFNEITVTLKSISNPAKELFELLAPRIDEISPESGISNSLIKITGDNFHPNRLDNTIILDDNIGEVIEASRKELTVKIPNEIYPNRSFQVGVEVVGQTAYSSTVFTIIDPWIKKENVPTEGSTRWRATGFSLLNKGYVGLGIGNTPFPIVDFYKFDTNQDTWEKIADFGGGQRSSAADFVIDNFAYVGSGFTGPTNSTATNDFWRFDPQTDAWTEIASLPISTTNAIGLSTNGMGYICTPDDSNNFWSYDPYNDEWSQMPDLITGSMGGLGKTNSGFVIDNKIYIYAMLDTNNKELYEFDPNTLQWSRKSDLIYSEGNEGEGFSMNNRGYLVIGYNFHEYNPLTDSWKILSPFPGMIRTHAVSFVIDGKAYYGSGSPEPYFWEYDPEYESGN